MTHVLSGASLTGPLVGKRVELPPSSDLWMRGARFGHIHGDKFDDQGRWLAIIRVDHPQVKRLAVFPVEDLNNGRGV